MGRQELTKFDENCKVLHLGRTGGQCLSVGPLEQERHRRARDSLTERHED